MGDVEHRVSAIEQARREIEDAVPMMAHLEKRQSDHMREQADRLAHREIILAEVGESWARSSSLS